MGRASDTCSIKGIRGDLTTSLSASWPHIDQSVWDHSQSVWQLNLEPLHIHAHIYTLTEMCTNTDFTYPEWCGYTRDSPQVYPCLPVCLSQLQKAEHKEEEEVLGDWISFIHCQLSGHENKWLSFFQLPGETCRNQIARIDLKTQSAEQAQWPPMAQDWYSTCFLYVHFCRIDDSKILEIKTPWHSVDIRSKFQIEMLPNAE